MPGVGGNSGVKNLLPLLQMMSNSCDYGGQKVSVIQYENIL